MANQNITKKNMNETKEEYLFEWHTSITSMPEDIWNACFKDNSTYNSYSYQKALERSYIPDVTFHYITASQENNVVAIATCFEYECSLDIIAKKSLRSCINFIKTYLLKEFFLQDI